jgi:hypothetical protein
MADVFGTTSSFSAEHGSHEQQSEQALSEEQVTALMTGDTPDTVARLAAVLGYMLKRSQPYYSWFHTTVRRLLVCCRFDPSDPYNAAPRQTAAAAAFPHRDTYTPICTYISVAHMYLSMI